MAAESAAILGTMSSTSLTGSSHGALAEMRTVEVSTSSSTLVSCDLEELRAGVRNRLRVRVGCSRHRQGHYVHPTWEGELRPGGGECVERDDVAAHLVECGRHLPVLQLAVGDPVDRARVHHILAELCDHVVRSRRERVLHAIVLHESRICALG
jgi:hypothetical protein